MKNTKSKPSHNPNRNRIKQSKSNKGIATNFAEGFENPKKWYEEVISAILIIFLLFQ